MKHLQSPAPRNEEEFQEFMEAMDRHFAELKVPIPARQLHAVAEIGHVLGMSSVRIPAERSPEPGKYIGDDLVLRAIAWFDDRYGDAQKVYMGPGRSLVLLRGDRWVIEYPTITGRAGFYAGDVSRSARVICEIDGTCSPVAPDSLLWGDPTPASRASQMPASG